MTVSTQIVTLSVTQTLAPNPSTLQQTGVFISQGGTTAAANSLTLLTSSASLASVLAAPLALSTLTWAGGTVTATTAVVHGLTVSQVYYLTISGALPAGYNGTYACTITGNTQFTYALASNPGNETAPGTYVSATQTELQQMNATFWAQGTSVSVYVLELGLGSVNAGVASLSTWIQNNLYTVYGILVPREWDNNAAFLALLAQYENTTSQLYFWVTTTNATYSAYDTANFKDVFALIEAPTLFATEFSLAAVFWVALSYNPTSANQITQLCFAYVFGVTPYPTVGSTTLFTNWKTAGVNYISTGAEGGIVNTMVVWGTVMSGQTFNYWYSADWLQININLDLSNAVINGSNDPQAPLYLNQQGINTLQAVAAGTLNSAITFGLLLGTVVQSELSGPAYTLALEQGVFAGQAVINAVPFVTYYTASPSDYGTGTYNGFSCTVTPLRGFTSITFFINLTNIVAL
jgi:hypothetical protein